MEQNKFIKERILALLVDQLIVSFLLSLIYTFFDIKFHLFDFTFLNNVWSVNFTFILLVSLLYYFSFDTIQGKASFGKMLLGIKNTTKNGSELTLKEKLKRSFIKVLSLSMIFFSLPYFFITRTFYHDESVNSETIKK